MAVLVWPFGSMIADRGGFARWVLCNGGVGSEMGLSRMVAASQREWWQDGSLLPLSFSVLTTLLSKSLACHFLCLAFDFLFFFFFSFVFPFGFGLLGLLFF